jgi:SAM-dependent methyltransferase
VVKSNPEKLTTVANIYEESMAEHPELEKVKDYFSEKLETYSATPRGVDWNSIESQEIRFLQLAKIIERKEHPSLPSKKYSLLDFGSGFGSMYDYLIHLGHDLHYIGYDIANLMIIKGRELHPDNPDCWFTVDIEEVPVADYAVSSGAFNMKLDADINTWTEIVIDCLHQMHEHSRIGFSFNMLTNYSDPEKMRPDLYYSDSLFFFDYCKRNFSKNVALLHDYKLYDYTILVRKD